MPVTALDAPTHAFGSGLSWAHARDCAGGSVSAVASTAGAMRSAIRSGLGVSVSGWRA